MSVVRSFGIVLTSTTYADAANTGPNCCTVLTLDFQHMVRAHEITPEGPPPDDKPSWDSGPPRDVWGPSRPPGAWEERTGNAQMWSAAPTPAEASRQHKKQNPPRTPRAFHQRRTDPPAFSTPSTRDDLSGIKFGHELTTGQLKVLENQTNRTDATKATADHDMQATTTTTSSSRSTKDPSDSSSETPIRTSGTGVPKQCADCKYIFPSYSKLQKVLEPLKQWPLSPVTDIKTASSRERSSGSARLRLPQVRTPVRKQSRPTQGKPLVILHDFPYLIPSSISASSNTLIPKLRKEAKKNCHAAKGKQTRSQVKCEQPINSRHTLTRPRGYHQAWKISSTSTLRHRSRSQDEGQRTLSLRSQMIA